MRSGSYITLKGDAGAYKAFVPSTLPFNIESNEVLQGLVSKADLALGRLDGITELLPDVDFFILMYIRKEATLSSQVEGTQATFADVLMAEANIPDIDESKDVDEILNYIAAMNYGLNRVKTLPLSVSLIREIHKILLKGVRGHGKNPGQIRATQNMIGGRTPLTATFVPPPPGKVGGLLSNLEIFLHDKRPTPVLLKTGLMHAQFENIHPFLDGNGRIGRLLITFYLCHEGVLRKPLLYLSEYFRQHRSEYYDRLAAFHDKDDIEGWLRFFLEGIEVTAIKAVHTSREIIKLQESDRQKIESLGRSTPRAIILFDSLFKMPLVTIKDIERICGIANPSALELVQKMIDLGILKETTGRKRNRIFEYSDYLKLFD